MARELVESSIDWIGNMPKHWEVQRLKNILIERNEKNDPIKTEFILSLIKGRGVIPYNEKGDIGNRAKDKLTDYKLAYPNDIVLNSMNVIIGSVGISKYFGAVSPVYYMLKPKNEKDSVRYFNYIFQTKTFQNKLVGYGNGILEHRMRIQMSKLNTVKLPCPSGEEQQKITNFLDEKVSQIDSIIENTKLSIEELKKYKQSLITETVTKGLNPDVGMRDSEVDSIPSFPKHWLFIKIKYFLDERKEKSKDGLEEPLSMTQKYGLVKSKTLEIPNPPTSNIGSKIVQPSDLVFNKLKAHLGVFSVSKYDGAVSPDYAVYYAKEDEMVNIKYLEYLFKTPNYINEFKRFSRGIAQGLTRLYTSDLFNIKCTLPPIVEQNRIVSFLETKLNHINNLVFQKEQIINEMQSYKSSLIYEYVTGKKEVI